MRMSCNGCRVLRKGCSEGCTIRPCLQWIKTPEAQANATVFLAKFYGRAGLLNLLAAGPDHLRPAVFRSLLYEACGRIVNPIYGSVGLLWSGQWQACQAAVEAVLKGHPAAQGLRHPPRLQGRRGRRRRQPAPRRARRPHPLQARLLQLQLQARRQACRSSRRQARRVPQQQQPDARDGAGGGGRRR
ncbi:seed specific protein Bn15D17A-like [Oryza sativa Japonica Group]|uniref:Seed specific protein Bn15D17A-like n=1 Tax=Oryza sativa subsp. japonica TaxID=39947 RepID=Q5QN63_ORYSJ|nr:seed specific protein Bn15D17A-like [Oryza sativa Japonica Group]